MAGNIWDRVRNTRFTGVRGETGFAATITRHKWRAMTRYAGQAR